MSTKVCSPGHAVVHRLSSSCRVALLLATALAFVGHAGLAENCIVNFNLMWNVELQGLLRDLEYIREKKLLGDSARSGKKVCQPIQVWRLVGLLMTQKV